MLEPGWYGAVAVDTGRTVLFCPRLPQEYAVWMGRITPPEEYRARYQVDDVYYVDQVSVVDRIYGFLQSTIIYSNVCIHQWNKKEFA